MKRIYINPENQVVELLQGYVLCASDLFGSDTDNLNQEDLFHD